MNGIVKPPLHGEILPPGEIVDVFLRPSPLSQQVHHLRLSAGLSLAEIVDECRAAQFIQKAFPVYVEIAGHAIPPDRWSRIRVKPGYSVSVLAVPGKTAFRTILSIVVSIGALFIAGPIAGALFGVGTAAAGAATGVIAAGIPACGKLSTTALFGGLE